MQSEVALRVVVVPEVPGALLALTVRRRLTPRAEVSGWPHALGLLHTADRTLIELFVGLLMIQKLEVRHARLLMHCAMEDVAILLVHSLSSSPHRIDGPPIVDVTQARVGRRVQGHMLLLLECVQPHADRASIEASFLEHLVDARENLLLALLRKHACYSGQGVCLQLHLPHII